MSAIPGSGLMAMGVELALNAAIQGSTGARADLRRLAGKVIALSLEGLPLKLWFLPQAERLTVAADYHGEADIEVRVPAASLLGSALQRDDNPPRGMQINGDAETAQVFSRLLKQADLDLEELLSRYTGDVAAHQIGNVFRGLRRWGRDAGGRLGRDLADYLQYESRDLPPRREVEAFLAGVDRLRDDAERLEARLKRAATRAGRP
ncbi:MAG TPA: SCP2 sterol-binding domain-containing protein [Gammaproteobacteria bacterium]|nr:SCP2 sterol-binding domain-containing protein [Gammaproteobacteria bacterium]